MYDTLCSTNYIGLYHISKVKMLRIFIPLILFFSIGPAIFSSAGFATQKIENVLLQPQGQKNMPRQAISKGTIFKSDISIFPYKLLTDLNVLFVEINRIIEEKKYPYYIQTLASAKLELSIEYLNKAIKTYETRAKNGLLDGMRKLAFVADLHKRLEHLAKLLVNLEAIELRTLDSLLETSTLSPDSEPSLIILKPKSRHINFSDAIKMTDELHTQLIPISTTIE